MRKLPSHSQAEVAALLRLNSEPKTMAEWERLAERRSSPPFVRLCAGIFLLYGRATGARESDPFVRDATTWAVFEQAALPEMAAFSFYERSQDTTRTPNSVLADAMGWIWTAEELPDTVGQPSTIRVIAEFTKHICSIYEITALDRRTRKRASLGLDVLG